MKRALSFEILIGICLVALCFVVYGSSLTGFFSGTDTFSLIETGKVDEVRGLGRILIRPLMAGTGFTSIALYYRPLSSLSFGFDHAIWGLRPFGYALSNLLLHAINTLLVFFLLRTQGRMRLSAASLGAAIFVLIPAMIEVVPVMSRRQDMLALLLGMLALTAYRGKHSREVPSRLLGVASVVLFGLALLAKEIAAVFAMLIPADRVLIVRGERRASKEDVRQGLKDSLPYLVVLTLFLAFRFMVLGGMGGEQSHGGIAAEGGLGRALGVLVRFSLEIVDPSKSLMTSGPGAWVPALLAAIILFGAAASVMFRMPATASSDRPRWRSWRSPRSVAVSALLVVGCALIGLALARAASLPAAIEDKGISAAGHVFIKAILIGLVLAIILGITLADRRFEQRLQGKLERSAYYALWILLPLGIYMAAGTFSARVLYVPAVGVAATLAGLIDAVPAALAVADSPRGRRPSLVVWIAAGAVVYFLAGSMMLSSPAVRGLGEWPAKSRLAKSFFEEFDRQIGPRGPCEQIIISGLPDRGTIGLEEYSVQSWIHLRYPEWDAHVKLNDRVPMTTIPANLELRAGECTAGQLLAQVELP